MGTFHIICDPNRPLQIGRQAYRETILPQLTAALSELQALPVPADHKTFQAVNVIEHRLIVAIDVLRQEAEAGNE